MSNPRAPVAPASSPSTEDRLESWKEIAAYLRRDVTTVQRWERREGMPVHRHVHDKVGSVHAFRSELDAWAASRRAVIDEPAAREVGTPPAVVNRRRHWPAWGVAALGALVLVAVLARQFLSPGDTPENPLADARFVQLTNFDGSEQAAALSRDGRFVAFLSDRDGRMDVWVTQVGAGQFYNLTRGTAPELVNPSVRTLGFSPDGTQVTFWVRRPTGPGRSAIDILSAPVLGGTPRPYLEGVAEFDWSPDGRRLVYHTPGPGDPTFLRDPGSDARQIFSAPAGLHAHFPVWSPNSTFIYFVQGAVPDAMDIWRLRPDGGAPERITQHDSRVSHPVFLDDRTLLYLATDGDGSGPWLHTVDVERRQPRRVGVGLERYTSLAASADGRTITATRASMSTTLWRVPIGSGSVDASAAERIALSTGSGRSARLGPGYLVYVAATGDSDSIWKLQDGAATELWRAADARMIGAPAIARNGKHIAFSARQAGRASLYVMNADGTNARALAGSLEPHGTPAWAPGDTSLTVAAVVDGAPRLFTVPLDGSTPTPFVVEHAANPAWSPDGALVVYSGPDIGTTFSLKVRFTTDEGRHAVPDLTLSRGSRHLAFMPGGRSLVMLRGEIGHKNVWVVDLETGAERQLTRFAPEFSVRDFDISADGRELVIERLQEHADIVLILRDR